MRRAFDLDAYLVRARSACFICELVAGNAEYRHHVVFEDEHAIAFLTRYPTVRGYVLVAPKAHREQVTGDSSQEEFLRFQAVLYTVGEAVRQAFAPERLYLLSLGSQAANRHVHWHVVPLPEGLPFDEQQLEFLRVERGVLDLTEAEFEADAARIRAVL